LYGKKAAMNPNKMSAEASEQIWHPGGEIILRLTGEERQSDKDPKRQQQSFRTTLDW
jgi:hypothetical protein